MKVAADGSSSALQIFVSSSSVDLLLFCFETKSVESSNGSNVL